MNSEKIKEMKIEVYGRVQGVRFRESVKEIADFMDLKGYVRNRAEGGAIIIVQGEEGKVKEFLSEVEKGPGFSRVEDFDFEWKNPEISYEEFSVSKDRGFVGDQIDSFKNLGRFLLGQDLGKVPESVVIIPDGNRRWAKEKGLVETKGHYKSGSYQNIVELCDECIRLGIKYLGIWGFSTENWKRDEKEKEAIFDLIKGLIPKLEKYGKEKEVRFRHIGRRDRLPRDLIRELERLEKETEKFDKFNVQLMLDYGGKDEIVRAVNKILKKGKAKISEEELSENLDTYGIPDPDLVIRTSGERRTSGLLPWQSGYSEWYFADVYFPDFDVKEFMKAIQSYGRRKRRFGGN